MCGKIVLIFVFIFSFISPLYGQKAGEALSSVEFSGLSGIELRVFPEQPKYVDQFQHFQPSLILEPELSYDSSSRLHQFNFVPFIRLDEQDDKRTHVDIREAYWRYAGKEWEVLVGINRVFFGVAESRHLVNIINQVDQVEDIDEEEFLGQPMVNIATQRDWGRIDLYLMSGFRERTFPGSSGRLRTELSVNMDEAEFESSLNEAQPDVVARYSHFVGDWDVGFYYFYGTGREPRLVTSVDKSRLIPSYDMISQVGADVQLTREATLYKFEGIIRKGQGDTFGAVVAGFEHTLFRIFETSADLGLLSEYLFDDRRNDAPVTSLDDDLFFGMRLSLNDIQDTSALLGLIVDLGSGSSSARFEAARRVGDHWKVELDGQWFFNVDNQDPLYQLKDDGFLALKLLRFF